MKRKLTNLKRRFARDESGNILLMAGAGFAMLVGAAGVGADTVQWYLWNRQLQQAADSGALAGALALHQGADFDPTARAELARTANTSFVIETLTNPPSSGDYIGDTGAIELIATTSRKLPFSGMFMSAPPTIRVRSVAATITGGKHCVISLADDGVGVEMQGTADVDLGCGVVANSRGASAIYFHGSSYLDGSPISSAGGIVYDEVNLPANAGLQPFGIPVDDPLEERGLTVPDTTGSCDQTNYTVKPGTSAEIYPGMYCGGINVRGTLLMHPGVYLIAGGSFKSNSQATIIGKGVTIILTNKGGAGDAATVDLNGGAKLELTAPTLDQDPDWAGILFFQDQIGSAQRSKINGGSELIMDGIIYMPGGDLDFSGNANQKSQCLLLVAKRVGFAGQSNIKNNCGPEVESYTSRTKIIRVVE